MCVCACVCVLRDIFSSTLRDGHKMEKDREESRVFFFFLTIRLGHAFLLASQQRQASSSRAQLNYFYSSRLLLYLRSNLFYPLWLDCRPWTGTYSNWIGWRNDWLKRKKRDNNKKTKQNNLWSSISNASFCRPWIATRIDVSLLFFYLFISTDLSASLHFQNSSVSTRRRNIVWHSRRHRRRRRRRIGKSLEK